MRRVLLLLILAVGLAGIAGCSNIRFDLWRSVLGSVYSSFGDGNSADRFSNFNDRYDQQSKAAEEYYREHP